VTRFTAATAETLEAVYNFVMGALADAGVPVDIAKRSRLSANRDFLHVRLPVHVGEAMFGVRLHRFVHSKTAGTCSAACALIACPASGLGCTRGLTHRVPWLHSSIVSARA